MLAATIEDISKLKYPIYASPKLDGIRCLTIDGNAYTYSRLNEKFKLIVNRGIRSLLKTLPSGLDGELITLDNQGKHNKFNDVQSKVMSENVKATFQYLVFDYLPNEQCHVPFKHRIEQLVSLNIDAFFVSIIPQTLISSKDELEIYEESIVSTGYEGVMLRATHAPYKQSRSTLNEGYLLKLKRFTDAEATVVGFEELVREHTSEKTNMLGALICRSCDDIMFNIGTGFTEWDRKWIWKGRVELEGKQVTFKYQKQRTIDKPISAVFLHFRLD